MTLRRLYSRVRRACRHSGVVCLLRRRHIVRRIPMGHRCRECRRASGDYEDFGLTGGYVHPLRKLFTREHGGALTRTSAWSEAKRGGW